MRESEICRRIYDICLPHAKNFEAPAAYICIDFGHECTLREDTLKTEYAGIKWNTPLSASELLIRRKPPAAARDETVTVVSIKYFEEDGRARAKAVSLGTVLPEV